MIIIIISIIINHSININNSITFFEKVIPTTKVWNNRKMEKSGGVFLQVTFIDVRQKP